MAIADAMCEGVQSGERLTHLVAHIAHEYSVKQQSVYLIWKCKTYDRYTHMSERRLKVSVNSRAILGQAAHMLQQHPAVAPALHLH